MCYYDFYIHVIIRSYKARPIKKIILDTNCHKKYHLLLLNIKLNANINPNIIHEDLIEGAVHNYK